MSLKLVIGNTRYIIKKYEVEIPMQPNWPAIVNDVLDFNANCKMAVSLVVSKNLSDKILEHFITCSSQNFRIKYAGDYFDISFTDILAASILSRPYKNKFLISLISGWQYGRLYNRSRTNYMEFL